MLTGKLEEVLFYSLTVKQCQVLIRLCLLPNENQKEVINNLIIYLDKIIKEYYLTNKY